MMKIIKDPSEGKCSKCESYQEQIARLKKGFIQADDENVRRSMQYEDKILELKAKIKRSKAQLGLVSQSENKVLEVVRQPDPNTLRAPNSLNVTNKKYDTKDRIVEDEDKPFHGDSKTSHRS